MNNDVPNDSELDNADVVYASAFDQQADPLAEYSEQFYTLPDPFDYFITNVLRNRDSISDVETYDHYQRTYQQWKDHMAAVSENRHPACPTAEHVKRFIEWRRDIHGNSRRTIKGKLSRLSQAYEYWQEKSVFPHPSDWNPFTIGRKETNLGDNDDRTHHDVSLQMLQERFGDIREIRSRGIVATQLKEGLRAGELCNGKISEVDITHPELKEHYPEMGSHPAIEDYSDVIYIPHDRDGNKSSNPRILPIDDELRWILTRQLLTRPQVNEPWIFLSKRTFTKMKPQGVNKVWKEEFHPEFAATDEHIAITSHYGRHWFSSFWRLEENLEREHIQYMRGDLVQPIDEFPDAIDDYLHPNFRQIESVYRQNVFKLDVTMSHV